MNTTASIARAAGVTQAAVWERAKRLGIVPVTYAGKTAIWSDAAFVALVEKPAMGRPRSAKP